MKPDKIFQEFEKLAETLQIKIIQEKGNFKGGYCLLEKEKIIVINKLQPMEQRVRALTQAFTQLDISQIYMKPVLRGIIESEELLHQSPSRKYS